MIDLLDELDTFALTLDKVSSGKGYWKVQLTQTFDELPQLPAWAEPHREGIISALHGERGLKATVDFADREIRLVTIAVSGEDRAVVPDYYEQHADGLPWKMDWNTASIASVQLVASVKTGELVVRWTLHLPTVPGAWGRLACEAQLLARCLGRQPDVVVRPALEEQERPKVGDLFETIETPNVRKAAPKAARARISRSRVDA